LKRNEMRVLLDQAYDTLGHASCEAAAERALLVLASAPKEPESYLLMAEVAQENQRAEQALIWIDQGLLHHPQHLGLLVKKASVLIDDFEDIDEAFSILNGIVENHKNLPTATIKREYGTPLILEMYLLLTDCLRLKGRYLDALTYATLGKDIAPFDENALLALATAYFELGDYDQALTLIEPVDTREEPSDFFRLKAYVLCAKGQFIPADAAFNSSYKADKSRYHRPQRLTQELFLQAFDQALLALPREIREFIETCAVEISSIVPLDRVKSSYGTLSPQACIIIDTVGKQDTGRLAIISLFQKNIENLAVKKGDIKDIIASALLHELAKVVTPS
jgi:tetratricopeptide (TPR) repeat protein